MTSYRIPFYRPQLNEKQIKLLNEVSHSDQLKVGPKCREAEEFLEDHFQKPVKLTSSGTTALAYALRCFVGDHIEQKRVGLGRRFCSNQIYAINIANRAITTDNVTQDDNDRYSFHPHYSVIYNNWIPYGWGKKPTEVIDLCQVAPEFYKQAWDFSQMGITSFGPTKIMRGIGGGAIITDHLMDFRTAFFEASCEPNEFQAAAILGLDWSEISNRMEQWTLNAQIYEAALVGGQGGPLWYEFNYDMTVRSALRQGGVEISRFYYNDGGPSRIAIPTDVTIWQCKDILQILKPFMIS